MISAELIERQRIFHFKTPALNHRDKAPHIDTTIKLPFGWLADLRKNDPIWRVVENVVIPLRPETGFWLKSEQEKLLRDRRVALGDENAFMLMVRNRFEPGGWAHEVVRQADILLQYPGNLLIESEFMRESGNPIKARSLQVAYSARTGNQKLRIYPNVIA